VLLVVFELLLFKVFVHATGNNIVLFEKKNLGGELEYLEGIEFWILIPVKFGYKKTKIKQGLQYPEMVIQTGFFLSLP
jgi:hypothetical protein